MSALSRFEQFVEQLIEGGFTRLLRSQLQPVEIAKRLARAMEDSQAISTGGKVVVANRYEVLLNPQDFTLFEPYKASLEAELASYAAAVAKERRFFLASEAMVVLSSSSLAMPKRPLIRPTKADAAAMDRMTAHFGDSSVPAKEPAPVEEEGGAGLEHTSRLHLGARAQAGGRTRGYLRLHGRSDVERIPIAWSPFTIGRGLDNDLVLEDKRVSRNHARIEDLHSRLLLVDLQSTNGTAVNGETVSSRCLLANRDVVSFGGVELVVALEEGA